MSADSSEAILPILPKTESASRWKERLVKMRKHFKYFVRTKC